MMIHSLINNMGSNGRGKPICTSDLDSSSSNPSPTITAPKPKQKVEDPEAW